MIFSCGSSRAVWLHDDSIKNKSMTSDMPSGHWAYPLAEKDLNSRMTSRRPHAVKLLDVVRRTGIIKLVSAEGSFDGRPKHTPVAQRQAQIRGAQHCKRRANDVRERQVERAIAKNARAAQIWGHHGQVTAAGSEHGIRGVNCSSGMAGTGS